MPTFRALRRLIPAVAVPMASLVAYGGCGLEGAPDMKGEYDVQWTVIYYPPDATERETILGADPSRPFGSCWGTVRIARQHQHSFEGTIAVPAGAAPPCYPAEFPLTGTIDCVEAHGLSTMEPYDPITYTQCDFNALSDIEPLLQCTFIAPVLTDLPAGVHGTLTRQEWSGSGPGLVLMFKNRYQCPSGRWAIAARADGVRRGSSF